MTLNRPHETTAVTVLDLADAQCRRGRADALALRWIGRRGECRDFTYGNLADAAHRCARLLLGLGLKPGEAVAVMTGREPETVVAALGIWLVGGAYCPLFTDLGPEPVRARLSLGEIRLLIVCEDSYRRAVAPIRASLNQLRHVLVLGSEVPEGSLDLRAGLLAAPDGRVVSPQGSAGPATIHFTSGTTAPTTGGEARPKAVVHDAPIVSMARDVATLALGLRPSDMMWCTGEPGWVTHTVYGLMAPLACGAAILMDELPPTPRRCLAVLEEEPVNIWITSPTVIRGIIGGGAAVARQSTVRWERKTGKERERERDAQLVHWSMHPQKQKKKATW